ncbi:MAG: cupredoxin domain-containing protein [Nitrospirales bacterium]
MVWNTLSRPRIIGSIVTLCIGIGVFSQVNAQPEQYVDVRIKDFEFRATQMPLQLNAQTVIHIVNEDNVRHDFGSSIFSDTPTKVESGGVTTYGSSIDGAFVEADHEVTFRFVIHRPGRYQFECSIHPDMKGEILLLSAGAV